MVKKLLWGFITVVAVLLVYASTRPDTFRVERSISMHASPAKVYSLLSDFHQFSAWSPWEKLDPAMKTQHSGAAVGKGAVYTWDGNDQVGAGRMEILQTTTDQQVTVQLDFVRPFASRNTSQYTIAADGDATKVTWAMYGPTPYISKLMGIFVSMDSMIGKDFERGLRALKEVSEKP